MKAISKKAGILLILLCFLQLFVFSIQAASAPEIWSGGVATEYAGGDGTEENPYLISNGEQLALLAQQVNEMIENTQGKHYKLTNEIVLNNTNEWENWEESVEIVGLNQWTPIGLGNMSYNFKGVFDGNNHKIIGLYYSKKDAFNDSGNKIYKNNIGLFGGIDPEGLVKNLGIEKSFVMGDSAVGGIAGQNHGTIFNSYNKGTVKAVNFAGGGIAGELSSVSAAQAIVEECYNEGKIIGLGSESGGIVGFIMTDNLNEDVAIVDMKPSVLIKHSYNIGKIEGSGPLCGGIVGGISQSAYAGPYLKLENEPSVIIENCYNMGEVRGTFSLGGIVGQAEAYVKAADLKVLNSYNEGTVKPLNSNSTEVGGIVGLVKGKGKINISDCYCTGDLVIESGQGTNHLQMGGIVGSSISDDTNTHELKIENCYFSGEIQKANVSGPVGGILGSYSDKCNLELGYSYYLKNNEKNNTVELVGIDPQYFDDKINVTGCGYFARYNAELEPWHDCTILAKDKANLLTSLNNHRGDSVIWFEDKDGIPRVKVFTGPSIAPMIAVFDKSESSEYFKDIEIILKDSEGYTFAQLKQGSVVLEQDKYTIDSTGKKVTIKKDYLKTLEKGDYKFTFDFADLDRDPELNLTVIEDATIAKITLSIKMPDDETDVTDKCDISWYDLNGQIASGPILENSEIGKSYSYTVTLKENSGLTGVYGGNDTILGKGTEQNLVFRLKNYDKFELIVKNEKDEDVTDQCDITWYTLKNYFYQVLGQESELEYKYRLNDTYTYSIKFKNDDWSKEYKLPKDAGVKAKEGTKEIEVKLEKLEEINFKGRIVLNNATEESDITKTVILIKQGNLYDSSDAINISPNEAGEFELTLKKVATSISVNHENYKTKSLSFVENDFKGQEYFLSIELDPKSCSNYYGLDISYGEKRLVAGHHEFDFELKDTEGRSINFYIRNGTLVLVPNPQEGFPVGKELELTVRPNVNYIFADEVSVKFKTLLVSTIDDEVEIDLVKWGDAEGTLVFDQGQRNYNAQILVFDKGKNLVSNRSYGPTYKNVFVEGLIEGDYTMIGIISNQLIKKVSSQEQFEEFGFNENDYFKAEFTLVKNQTIDLGDIYIPYFDIYEHFIKKEGLLKESKSYWNPESMDVVLDTDVLLCLDYELVENLENLPIIEDISYEKEIIIKVHIPSTVKLLQQAGYITVFDHTGKRLNATINTEPSYFTIKTKALSGKLYFYVNKTTFGTSNISASLDYSIKVGGTTYSEKNISLGGVAIAADMESISLNGRSDCLVKVQNSMWIFAAPGCEAQLYVDGKPKGSPVKANSIGSAHFKFDMDYEADDKYHELYVEYKVGVETFISKNIYMLYPSNEKVAWLETVDIDFIGIWASYRSLLKRGEAPNTNYRTYYASAATPNAYTFTAEFKNAEYVDENSLVLWVGLQDGTWEAIKLYRVDQSDRFIGQLNLANRSFVSAWTLEFVTKTLSNHAATGKTNQTAAHLAKLNVKKEDDGNPVLDNNGKPVYDIENLFANFGDNSGQTLLQSSDSPEFEDYTEADQKKVLEYEAEAAEFKQQILSYLEGYARAFVNPDFVFSSSNPSDADIDKALGISNIGFTKTEDLAAKHSELTGKTDYQFIDGYPTNSQLPNTVASQKSLKSSGQGIATFSLMETRDVSDVQEWTKQLPAGISAEQWKDSIVRDQWFKEQGYKKYGDGTGVDYYVLSASYENATLDQKPCLDEYLYNYAYDNKNPEKSSDGISCTSWVTTFENNGERTNYINQKKGIDTPAGREAVEIQEEKVTIAKREIDWTLEVLTGTMERMQEKIDWSDSSYYNFMAFFFPSAVENVFETARFNEKNRLLGEMEDWLFDRNVKSDCNDEALDYAWDVIQKTKTYNRLRMSSSTLLATANIASFVKDFAENMATKAGRIEMAVDYAKQLMDEAVGFDTSLNVGSMIEDGIKDELKGMVDSFLSDNEKLMDSLLFDSLRAYYASCKVKSDSKPPMLDNFSNVNVLYDPSGYVYEAVESNRLEGVKATVYYKEEDERIKWLAEDFDQINDQITESNGEYGWMVPDGQWQVDFSKAGYENVTSAVHPNATTDKEVITQGWLPVPPIQLGINIPMTSTAKPVVEYVKCLCRLYPSRVQPIHGCQHFNH